MLTIMWIPVLIQFATLLLAAVVAAASRSYLAAMLLVMIGMIAALVVAAYRSYQFWPMALVQADHPQLNAEQVMERCKAMTEGRKFDLFVFDLSYLGWNILSLLTGGILSVLYVAPYKMMATAFVYEEIKCIKDAGDFWSDSILPQRKIVPVSCHFKRPGNCSTGDSTDERCNRSNQHIGNDDSRQTKQLERCRHNRRHDPNAACDHRTQQDTCDCRNHPIQNLHADHSGQISVFIQNTFCLFFISSPIYHNDSPLFRFTSGIFRCTREQTSVSCRRC